MSTNLLRIGGPGECRSKIFRAHRIGICAAAAVLIFALCPGTRGAEGAAGLSATNRADEVSPEMRAYLQLQEQLRATQLAVERNRKESTETALQTAEALAGGMKATTDTLATRMKVLEEALNTQRMHELDVMQGSNRTMLIVAGTFACLGFVALFLMGYFQWRTVNRLAEISAFLPKPGLALPGQRPRAALMAGESPVMASEPGGSDNADLLQTIAQLENRIHDLERDSANHTGNGEGREHEAGAGNPEVAGRESRSDSQNGLDADAKGESAPEGTDRIAVLLGKGQSLLNVEKPEEALSCFEQVLALDAKNPEALVKKGAALERLRKLNEAIECYDRAIEADSTMTIAYLYKGGLCNRMERFNEALQCYEQALRTQEKRAA